MTLDEFLTELENPEFTCSWYLNIDGQIRAYDAVMDTLHCPLSWVAATKSGCQVDITDWREASLALSLPLPEGHEILKAADNRSRANRDLEYRLLQSCGIFV